MRLALLHPDVAALRRYLVDGRLMTREAGIYRRAEPMPATADGRDPLAGLRSGAAGSAAARSSGCRSAPGPPCTRRRRSARSAPKSPSRRR